MWSKWTSNDHRWDLPVMVWFAGKQSPCFAGPRVKFAADSRGNLLHAWNTTESMLRGALTADETWSVFASSSSHKLGPLN